MTTVYGVMIGGKPCTAVARKDEHTLSCVVAADAPLGTSAVTVTKDGAKLVELPGGFLVAQPTYLNLEPLASATVAAGEGVYVALRASFAGSITYQDVAMQATWTSADPNAVEAPNAANGWRAVGKKPTAPGKDVRVTGGYGGLADVLQVTVVGAVTELKSPGYAKPGGFHTRVGFVFPVECKAMLAGGGDGFEVAGAAWTSGDEPIVTVAGLYAHAHKVGATTLTATYAGKTLVVPVTVHDKLIGPIELESELQLQPSNVMEPGDTTTMFCGAHYVTGDDTTYLPVEALTWTCSDPAVLELGGTARMSDDIPTRTVIARKPGTATITATVTGQPELTSQFKVTVKARPAGLVADPDKWTLAEGQVVRVRAIRTDNTGASREADATYGFYNTAGNSIYATIDGDGYLAVTGVACPDPIPVKVLDGNDAAESTLTVYGGQTPTAATLPPTVAVKQGEDYQGLYFALVLPDNTRVEGLFADSREVTWASADKSKVTVNNAGTLHGVATTSAPVDVTVTVAARKDRPELKATTKVTVTTDAAKADYYHGPPKQQQQRRESR